MKKFFLAILLLSLFLLSACSQQNVVLPNGDIFSCPEGTHYITYTVYKEKNANDAVQINKCVLDSDRYVENGPIIIYHKDTTMPPELKGMYCHSHQCGIWVTWEKGELKEITCYNTIGQLNGPRILFDGNLVRIERYREDLAQKTAIVTNSSTGDLVAIFVPREGGHGWIKTPIPKNAFTDIQKYYLEKEAREILLTYKSYTNF